MEIFKTTDRVPVFCLDIRLQDRKFNFYFQNENGYFLSAVVNNEALLFTVPVRLSYGKPHGNRHLQEFAIEIKLTKISAMRSAVPSHSFRNHSMETLKIIPAKM